MDDHGGRLWQRGGLQSLPEVFDFFTHIFVPATFSLGCAVRSQSHPLLSSSLSSNSGSSKLEFVSWLPF